MSILCTIIAVGSLMAGSAFAQTGPRRELRADGSTSAPNPRQQIQQRITDIYISDFRGAVELSDEQFLKLSPTVREFIQMRFQAANVREELKRRQELLLSQPNPSEADFHKLSEEQARFENNQGTMETRFVTQLRSELSPRQIQLVRRFNTRFFEQRLPALLERARAAAASGDRPQRPAAAGRQNRGDLPARNGTTLRGKNN